MHCPRLESIDRDWAYVGSCPVPVKLCSLHTSARGQAEQIIQVQVLHLSCPRNPRGISD